MEAADSSSGSGRSYRGCSSVAEEPAILSLDSGRNSTWSDNRRKLQALARSLDSSIIDRGRLGPLHLQRRLLQKVSATEAKVALGLARGCTGMKGGF